MAALKFFSVAISPLKGSLCVMCWVQALLSENVLLIVINRVFSHLELKRVLLMLRLRNLSLNCFSCAVLC
jgi:hypothetical protein